MQEMLSFRLHFDPPGGLLTQHLKDFAVSQRITHSVYGAGTITSLDDRHVVIEFDEGGRKKFVTSIVQLEHSETPAPTPRKRKPKVAKTAKAK